MALVDTHCHLYLDAFQDDLDQVLERAWQQGLERILVPGIDLETSRSVVSLADCYPQIYAAVGVHPNHAVSWTRDTLGILTELADHPKVVAVGEIGLDYYRDDAPHQLQQNILHLQLELAAKMNLPVVLHNRNALTDLWSILHPWQRAMEDNQSPIAKRPGVLHSYEGDLDTALLAASQNFKIGISGTVTFRNAQHRQQVTAGLPPACVVLETDAPFLAPQPHRGQRNEPGFVSFIAKKVAELHQMPLAELIGLTTDNAAQLFEWRMSV
ncbi:MAG: TatD family hydrolase [Anaerolineaceae bacterium]